jgi:hypothetical protein
MRRPSPFPGFAVARSTLSLPMADPLIQTLAIGVLVALLAFELLVAVTTLIGTHQVVPIDNRTPLWFTRPSAIRDHMKVRQSTISAMRRDYPALRSSGHGHDVRNAIRRLRPTPGPDMLATCPTCRWSRRRGLEHCPACGSRLVVPAHATFA